MSPGALPNWAGWVITLQLIPSSARCTSFAFQLKLLLSFNSIASFGDMWSCDPAFTQSLNTKQILKRPQYLD